MELSKVEQKNDNEVSSSSNSTEETLISKTKFMEDLILDSFITYCNKYLSISEDHLLLAFRLSGMFISYLNDKNCLTVLRKPERNLDGLDYKSSFNRICTHIDL